MGTTINFIEYVMDCMTPLFHYTMRYKKLFGEYCFYADEHPIFLVCDNQVFVKQIEALAPFIKEPILATPYEGAKLHYVIDIDDASLLKQIVPILIDTIPPSKPKSTKK